VPAFHLADFNIGNRETGIVNRQSGERALAGAIESAKAYSFPENEESEGKEMEESGVTGAGEGETKGAYGTGLGET
jgi:hypothetical protein